MELQDELGLGVYDYRARNYTNGGLYPKSNPSGKTAEEWEQNNL